jgi:hypothetical protein
MTHTTSNGRSRSTTAEEPATWSLKTLISAWRRTPDQSASRSATYHLVDQIESFRIGDKDSKREDDLLDTFCGAVRNAVGIRVGEFSGNMKLSFQAARSIG